MSLRFRKPNEPEICDHEHSLLALAKLQKRRWRLAFDVIRFTRALASLSKIALDSNKQILRSLSYVAIDIGRALPHDDAGVNFLDIDQKILTTMVKQKNFESLSNLGGVKQVAAILGTDEKNGVPGNEAQLLHRTNVFGKNCYKKPDAKSFLSFVYEALKDTTIIILLVCAILSLAFGIKEDGLKEGWYDGSSIIFAVFLIVIVSAVSNFKQNRQFEKLSDESGDIKVEVVRDGRRQAASIFEVVVGDTVCLKIGDQILTDGLFLNGYSLKVDESSMTGESDHVEINGRENPFLLSGTKVTDGYGSMLFTSVGMKTAWGEMMSSISRDLDEQTPLQVRLKKMTSYIGKIGLTVAVMVLLVMLICYFTGNTTDERGDREFNCDKSDEERMAKIDKISVMARSSPFDKLLMVQCLKQKGHVVAVTGDGTNDAPALKEADIGLSMGIQGTEVAKESSDIIILDDNFSSMVTVLRWGRCDYNNIQKFIQFQLTVNVVALVINFIAAVSSGDVPLTAVQLLWVNLIMDTLGALALATEQPTNQLMTKPPVGRSAPLITKVMWRNLVAQALYQVIVLLILQFNGRSIFSVDEKIKNTLIFNTFVFCQIFNEFNARILEEKNIFKGLHKNKLFIGIVGTTLILQVLMVEFLNNFANTKRLNLEQWGVCVCIAAMSWLIGWLVKWIPVSAK
ncbi:putative calcium-transporting ATPase 13, plasma membrane-type [Pistacia vera]|uniref:putative calcium-transporting ATPase 13, plasma membrane-type n=1 Tax=Pistacia vera TaxID=55513 RepID=UPI001263B525|nr:putative calcium-transporting ATPase 13, plasma membrane-type [Pistacia vera]